MLSSRASFPMTLFALVRKLRIKEVTHAWHMPYLSVSLTWLFPTSSPSFHSLLLTMHSYSAPTCKLHELCTRTCAEQRGVTEGERCWRKNPAAADDEGTNPAPEEVQMEKQSCHKQPVIPSWVNGSVRKVHDTIDSQARSHKSLHTCLRPSSSANLV